MELGGQVWIAGGKDEPGLARLDPDSSQVFVAPLKKGEIHYAFTSGIAWKDRLWLATNTDNLEFDPHSMSYRILTAPGHSYSNHCFTKTNDFLILSQGNGLFSFDQEMKACNHGVAMGDCYDDDKGERKGFLFYFITRHPSYQGLEGLDYETAQIHYLLTSKSDPRYKGHILSNLKQHLIPETRMPPIGCLAGDGEWLWVVSGKRLFLYHPSTQTWHGCISLSHVATSIVVGERWLWLGGENLQRVDRKEALKSAFSKGLPNQLNPTEIEEAISRLVMGDQGLLYFGLGKFEQAADCLEKAVQEDITEPAYFLVLFMIYSPWGLDQPEKFTRYGNRLVEFYPHTIWSREVEDWRMFAKTHPLKKEGAK